MSLATDHASSAEVAAVQLPQLAAFRPRRVVLQLGDRELRDRFDESCFHAHLVEVLDRIADIAPEAAIEVIGIPLAGDTTRDRDLFNAAARVSADLRGALWRDGRVCPSAQRASRTTRTTSIQEFGQGPQRNPIGGAVSAPY